MVTSSFFIAATGSGRYVFINSSEGGGRGMTSSWIVLSGVRVKMSIISHPYPWYQFDKKLTAAFLVSDKNVGLTSGIISQLYGILPVPGTMEVIWWKVAGMMGGWLINSLPCTDESNKTAPEWMKVELDIHGVLIMCFWDCFAKKAKFSF